MGDGNDALWFAEAMLGKGGQDVGVKVVCRRLLRS